MVSELESSPSPNRVRLTDASCEQPVNFDALTSLRFFAALSIFLLHAQVHELIILSADVRIWYSLIQGVAFFFALSGFVLTLRYENVTGWKQIALFYSNRFARIAPLYYLTAIPFVALPVLQHFGAKPWKEILAYAFALQDWSSNLAAQTPINPPAHSISSEVFFYALFPLFMISNKRWLGMAACASALLAILAWNFYRATGSTACTPVVGLIFFVAGILACLRFRRSQSGVKGQSGVEGTMLSTAAEIASLIAVIPLAIKATCPPADELVFAVSSISVDCSAIYPIALAIAFCFVLYIFAGERGLLSRLLKHRAFVLLGEASFAFFLVHYAVITVCRNVMKSVPSNAVPVLFVLSFLTSLAIALVLYRIVETPLRKLIAEKAKALFATVR